MATTRQHVANLSRRAFLHAAGTIGALLGSASVVGCSLDGGKDSTRTDTGTPDSGGGDSSAPDSSGGCQDSTPLPLDAGNANDLGVGDLQALSSGRVCVGRDADGVYAMTTICTHSGCDMATNGRINRAGLYCSCHGSKFDVNGAVTQGPATRDLDHYEVAVACDGTMTVDKQSVVSADAREAVP